MTAEEDMAITFKSTVSVSEVPHYGSTELKDDLWWNAEDFQEFLRVRVALWQEYKDAAKQNRLRGHSFDIQDPMLRSESKRGLGLGRVKLRQNNTKRYIQTVLKEQSRQRREANWQPGVPIDVEKIAEAARKVSASDVQYSIKRAEKDFEETRRDFEKTESQEDIFSPSHGNQDQPEQEPTPSSTDNESPSPDSGQTMKRVKSILLVDREGGGKRRRA